MSRATPCAIVWFRNDLRLDDNPALQAALRAGLTPVPVYIHAPQEEEPWRPGAASNAWRHRSLAALDTQLQRRGSRLQRFTGPTVHTLTRLVADTGAQAVFWNRRYEPVIEERDTHIKRALRALDVRAESFNGALLIEPWELQTRSGDPYRVFTPFWKAALSHWRLPAPITAPTVLPPAIDIPTDLPLQALQLAPRPQWDRSFWSAWTPGETGAQQALQHFIVHALHGYAQGRDRPDRPGTSRLSPHLHFGEISPRRIVRAIAEAGLETTTDGRGFVRELGWREFAHHVLHHFPHCAERNFNPRFDGFAWSEPSAQVLRAWQSGRTGVPIVDAGMRELWATGWMHNRVRMIVASFLTKNLRAHWLHGARWFWDTLVDADLANNSLGWQWVAGTGVDAAPYFRVFNPVLQARKFDPLGDYIARWIPELAPLPAALRHEPWRDAAALHRIAPAYPQQPLVDLASSRLDALAAYAALR